VAGRYDLGRDAWQAVMISVEMRGRPL